MRRYLVYVIPYYRDVYYVTSHTTQDANWTWSPDSALHCSKRQADSACVVAAELVSYWNSQSWGSWKMGVEEL